MKTLIVLASVAVVAFCSPVPNNLTVVPSDLKFLYYSRATGDNGIQVYLDNINTLHNTDYNPVRDTIFSIHGWQDDWSAAVNVEVIKSYLPVRDVNIFVVDWSKYSKADVGSAMANAPPVGQVVGQLINNMVMSAGLDLGKAAIVGHSMGGIVAENAGNGLGGQLEHIVGLDPVSCATTAAKFVQVIHTSGIGSNARGHADYWVNGGSNQPGCDDDGCSHWRSIVYFGESVRTGNFKANQCSDYNTYLSGACNNNPASYMGQAEVDKAAGGNYYLTTNSFEPFARG